MKKEEVRNFSFSQNMKTSILLTSCFLLLTSFALTREEIVERFRAMPVVKVDGLVEVVPDCSAETRREYQQRIAGNAGDLCRSLYRADCLSPKRFKEPGIVIVMGDSTNAVTNVVSRVVERADGSQSTRILLPSPAHADQHSYILAVARAYFLAVHGKTVDDKAAWHALMSSSPELRAAETCGRLADWSERGIYTDEMDDEAYLKLSRKVLLPGRLAKRELAGFASRLYLYPLAYDAPFCGKYTSIDFETAVRLRKRDLSIRFAAFVKAKQVLIFGAGRGEELQAAAEAYSDFLTELGRDEKTDGELLALLDTAEGRLRSAAVASR